ncbi:MAG TPA: ectoine/hydroxyectoine ABC transporter substrate-binding protein EhuB [Stackebrandtia sp.]|uniref:ectoine/hydroxyectoine ABC transporter substrate-binding protein EhuB n=1 Tax=Stackebrandtia sp. TaxID=2023065 RepID=UPI002D3C8B0A|nr:ectoine/hydroxyectoine ABC transporter substrate-binding protein EhuB [Stackebrandtia sp.]HZE40283.1 ectoine/hydroxyectoine ABC transporter substrate-binding protein EhuB [Stackebrandtia sp.]
MTARQRWSRRTIFKGGLVAGGLIATPGLLAACSSVGGSTLDKIKNGDDITIGVSGEAPYAFKDSSGKVTGESVEMYTTILKKLGAKDSQIKSKIVSFNSLIPGLGSGDFDLVTAGMFITPDRCGKALFSEPDYIAATTLLVKKGNPKHLKDFTSFKNGKAKVGVLKGAVEGKEAKEAKVPADSIQTRDNVDDLKSELDAGRIDAIALTSPTLRYAEKTSKGEFETVTAFKPLLKGVPQVGAGGAVFRKDDKDFRDKVNTELAKIKKDKAKWQSIVKPFGFTMDEYPTSDFTTAKLCKG